jgi:hypothetical protein
MSGFYVIQYGFMAEKKVHDSACTAMLKYRHMHHFYFRLSSQYVSDNSQPMVGVQQECHKTVKISHVTLVLLISGIKPPGILQLLLYH